MDAINIRDELAAYDRLQGKAKRTVGRRLTLAASDMTREIIKIESWLIWGDGKLCEEYHEGREDKWIAKLHELERLYDMREAIRERVLSA